MNKVILIGRLTKDPEIRSTSTGKKVASFSLAISDGKGPNGEDLTQYFDISAWEKLADTTENFLKKGMRVCVVGSLKNRTWDASDGTKRKATDITARELEILTSKTEMEMIGSGSSSAQSKPAQSQTQSASSQQGNDEEEEDLPEIDVNDINIQMPF